MLKHLNCLFCLIWCFLFTGCHRQLKTYIELPLQLLSKYVLHFQSKTTFTFRLFFVSWEWVIMSQRLTSLAFSCIRLRSCSSCCSFCSRMASFRCKKYQDSFFFYIQLMRTHRSILCKSKQGVTSAAVWVLLSLRHSDSSFSSLSCWIWGIGLLNCWFWFKVSLCLLVFSTIFFM